MEKIVGIVFAYDTKDEYDIVRNMGVDWIRLPTGFPWKDKMHGELSNGYLGNKENIKIAKQNGMKIMPTTCGMGGWSYNATLDKTVWHDEIPDFVGEKGTDEYYSNLREAAKFICDDLGDLVSDVWQVMNEIDIETFRGAYSVQIAADTCRALAEGICMANPNALCGTNLSNCCEMGLEVMDVVYRPGHVFRYIGDDQYFGSWQDGDVESWKGVIDTLCGRYKLPLIINEWGYSSGGRTETVWPDKALVPEGLPEVCYTKAWFFEVEGGHNEEIQAEYFRRGHELFAKDDRVLGSFMFCLKDAAHCWHCGQSECPAECFWGVINSDNSPKKAYYAIKDAVKKHYK